MHTPLFYLPYNIITFHSTVAADTGNADRTETAFEEGEGLQQAGSWLLWLAFESETTCKFCFFFFSFNGIDPLSSASLFHLIVLDILNSMSYNSLIHPEISALRWLIPIYSEFGSFTYLVFSSLYDWEKSKPMFHLLTLSDTWIIITNSLTGYISKTSKAERTTYFYNNS